MTEPSIEEIVTELEALIPASDHWVGADKNHMRALIASWRERGEALKPFAKNADATSLIEALGHITREHLKAARAAIKEQP